LNVSERNEVNQSKPIRILWHDDEIGGARESYVSPWLNWFTKEAPLLNVTVRKTSKLSELSSALKSEVLNFSLLIIDVMLKREPDQTFCALGFPNERVLRLDAGAQIAGLLRNELFDHQRPPWLNSYKATPLLLLSSSPTLSELVKLYVEADRRENIVAISKSLDISGDEARVDDSFDKTLRDLVTKLQRG
jgi:hypothetical protein